MFVVEQLSTSDGVKNLVVGVVVDVVSDNGRQCVSLQWQWKIDHEMMQKCQEVAAK